MQRTRERVGVVILGIALCAFAVVLSSSSPAEAGNGVLVRPISDFLDQQLPGEGNITWFSDETQKDAAYVSRVDFLGVINKFGFINPAAGINTEFTGKVTERVRSDGRTEVHIVLHGKNVFFWVGTYPTFFPVLASRLAGATNVGLSVDTCSTHYDLSYVTPNAPGAPMPRLAPLLFNTPEGWEILQSKVQAHGDCELRAAFGVPDGTPGRFSLNYVALVHPKGGDLTQDYTFPVGKIMLRPAGN